MNRHLGSVVVLTIVWFSTLASTDATAGVLPIPIGIYAWYDGANMNGLNNVGLVDGAALTTWKDVSGSATPHDLTNAGTPKFNATGFNNGQAAALLTANTDGLITSTGFGLGHASSRASGDIQYTQFVVFTTSAGSGQHLLWFGQGDTTGSTANAVGFEFNTASGNLTLAGGNGRNYVTNYTSSLANYTNKILAATKPLGLIAGLTVSVDGMVRSVSGTPHNGTNGILTSDKAAIGKLPIASNGGLVNGNVAEVIFYDSVLSNPAQIITHNYLSAKYNIAVGADRYAGDNAGTGNYDFNVFGIGKDIAAGTSSNIPAGTVATGNGGQGLKLTEINSSLDNGDYLLAGDKKVANSYVATLMPLGVDERWSRVFYVDKTGSMDAEFAFTWTNSGLTFDPSKSYGLLYSNSDNATFTLSSVLASTTNATQVSFNITNGNLASGYYTLGILSPVPEPSSSILMLIGVGAVFGALRRRRARV